MARQSQRLDLQGPEAAVVVLQHGPGHGLHLGVVEGGVHTLVELEEPPGADIGAVHHLEHVRPAGLFVGPGELDGVVGLVVDVGFVGVARQQGLLPHHAGGHHAPRLPEGEGAAIVEERVERPRGEEGLLQGCGDDVQTALLLHDKGGDGPPGVLQVPHSELEVLGDFPDDLPGGAAHKAVARLGLQVAQLVIADHVYDRVPVPGLGEDPAQEDELPVHGEPDRVALHEGDAAGGDDGKFQRPRGAGAVGGVGHLCHLWGGVPGLAGALLQDDELVGHISRPPGSGTP